MSHDNPAADPTCQRCLGTGVIRDDGDGNRAYAGAAPCTCTMPRLTTLRPDPPPGTITLYLTDIDTLTIDRALFPALQREVVRLAGETPPDAELLALQLLIASPPEPVCPRCAHSCTVFTFTENRPGKKHYKLNLACCPAHGQYKLTEAIAAGFIKALAAPDKETSP